MGLSHAELVKQILDAALKRYGTLRAPESIR
jgi:hypothetical protein